MMPIRHALRSLLRAPVFSSTVILTLALGLAAVGSMFAVVYGVLLAPLPYGDPDRLVSVGLDTAEQRRIGQPPGLYFSYQQFARRLAGVALYRTGSTNVRAMGDNDDAESVTATWVSASMMPLLQVAPLLGRSFTADEERRGGSDAVILSESEWRTRFSAATDVIGKTLIVNDVAREIVGVMPARFSFPTAATRVWLPAKYTDGEALTDFFYSGVARLVPGATAEQAQTELAAILPRVAESFPRLQTGGSTSTWLDDQSPRPVVLSLRDELTGPIARTLWILAAAAGLVLLVAWANVVNLMLVRADASQLDRSVREALGASRLHVASHFLSEAMVLGAIAGILALLLSYGAVAALVAFEPADVPRLTELKVGLTTTGFIALVTIAAVILLAAVPMVWRRRGNLSSHLHDGARGQTAGKSRQRLRSAITVLQIAVALVVLVGSALLLRTALQLHAVHPGFDARDVTTLRILLPFARYHDSATVAFFARLTESVAQLPTVRAAGLTGQLPLGAGWTMQQSFRIEGDGRTLTLPVNVIGNGYFAAMRIPLLAGRDFRSLDAPQGGDIIIGRLAAKTLFGDSNGVASLGKQLTLAPDGPTYTIVGIVGDVRYHDLATAPSAMIYRPQAVPLDPRVEPPPRPSMALVVRSVGPAGALVPAVRQIVRELDPTVPIYNVETMGDAVRASTARLSLVLVLMTAAAAITLLLSTIGLYGLMAYTVALRIREFGIRVAIGADPRRIARLVIARGLALTACGVAAGFALYAIAAPFLGAFLYEVSVADPVALATATLVMGVTASLACWLPAQRAAGVHPADALRAE